MKATVKCIRLEKIEIFKKKLTNLDKEIFYSKPWKKGKKMNSSPRPCEE